MSVPDSYELSAAYMDGLVSAVRRGGFLDGVLATMTEHERAAYLVPARAPWWDATFAERLAAAVAVVFGEWALDQVGYDVVAQAIGPQVQPLLQAALASGAGPEALFSQLGEFAKVAVRPMDVRWGQAAAGTGRLELIYPRVLERATQVLWRGAIRYGFEVSRRTGRIVEERQGPPGHLTYELSWD